MRSNLMLFIACVAMLLAFCTFGVSDDTESAYDPVAAALAEISTMDVGEHDWPQFFGWSNRNNTPYGETSRPSGTSSPG